MPASAPFVGRALARLERGHPSGLRGYLYGVARNVALEFERQRRARANGDGSDPEPEPDPDVAGPIAEVPQETAIEEPEPQASETPVEDAPEVPEPAADTPQGFDLNKVIARLVETDNGDGTATSTATSTATATAEPAEDPAAEEAPEPVPPAAEQTAAIPTQPDKAAPADAASKLNGYDAFKHGFVAARDGDLDQAIVYYSGAIDSGDLTLEDVAAVLYNRANAYHYKGLFDEAIADYDAALSNKPNFPAAHYNRGFAFAAKGLRTRAVEDYQKARELGLQRLGVRSPDLAPPFQ